MAVNILSGGAAQALVRRMAPEVQGSFGAVGAMRDKLLAGEPCDVVILTQALIDGLTAEGHVQPGSARPLGVVMTGVAVRAADPVPDVSSAAALRHALVHAPGIYFPDPQKATAGIHFMKVMKTLGVDVGMKDHFRTFPNGATAMGEMAKAPVPGVIGCTQVTEILAIPGVRLVGLLPKEFELATVYTAAVCTKAKDRAAAQALVELLAGDPAAAVRKECGFT
jgi:molybdate transport system substrate-binding protein